MAKLTHLNEHAFESIRNYRSGTVSGNCHVIE